MRRAILRGFTRVALRGTPYPTLTFYRDGQVEGALIRPVPRALVALRRYEGPLYRLVPIRVETRHGVMRARAWMAPRFLVGSRDWSNRA